ncbi:MAG: HK97 family phage prohead protease [bacterium]|nr:HK97 family phage prohead protease [bacterium]
MTELRHVEFGLETKFSKEDPEGTFSGYAAAFGNVDSHGDVIERGAFRKTLQEWEARKGKYPPMLLQHGGFFGPVDDELPIGQWTSMEENAKGLRVGGRLFALQTDRGALLYEGLKAGELDGISVGYRARKFTNGTKVGEPRRTLHEIELVEASIVTFPANDRARIASVKSADIDEITSLSDAEAFLREAGRAPWSKKAARDFVSRLSKIARREAGDDQNVSTLLAQLRETRRLIEPSS